MVIMMAEVRRKMLFNSTFAQLLWVIYTTPFLVGAAVLWAVGHWWQQRKRDKFDKTP
jgi:hypothetical protein